RFRESAHMFARELKARIVDDNREPVGPAAFEAIGAQLQAVHRSMEARGIAPGGALALRLFSWWGWQKRRARARGSFAGRSRRTITTTTSSTRRRSRTPSTTRCSGSWS